MNCAHVERNMYLYDELTPEERVETDRHMAKCAKCQATIERINQERAMLMRIRGLAAPVPDHTKITRRVMIRVMETQRRKHSVLQSIYLRLSAYLGLSAAPVRYAMAAVSLLLILTFAIEFRSGNGSQTITKQYSGNAQKHIQLNTASFYKTLTEKDHTSSTTESVYACLVGCVHTAEVDCTDCGNKFQNLIR